MDFKQLAGQYKAELLDNVVPFWLHKSQDLEKGGYFSCLDRDGSVYDTDKFIWLQCREVWMFAKLYNTVKSSPDGDAASDTFEKTRQQWLQCAIQGAEFLKKYGHDGHYNWYFAIDRDGNPLVEPYNIFSYTFAVIAYGQLSIATGNKEYAEIARKTFNVVLSKLDNPKGRWNKAVPGSRQLKTFDLPMILCNVSLEIESLLEPDFLRQTIDNCLHEVLDVFYRPELGLIVEAVGKDGSLIDCLDGRKMNPGHAIESTWFIMDLGKRLNRPGLIDKAVKIALNEVEYGWDKQYDGIFYFMDRLGKPRHELEFDQKLWWVHLETLISMLKGYQLTGNEDCLRWFRRVHDYTWSHFRDPEYPEWYGYLNRRGEVLLPLKGGKWKGCFHVPRGLLNCWQILDEIANRQQ